MQILNEHRNECRKLGVEGDKGVFTTAVRKMADFREFKQAWNVFQMAEK